MRVWTSPAAQLLRAHLFSSRGLDQRRAAEKDRALVADDHRLVRHRRDVRAAGGARSHHDGDLRDRLRRHVRLVVEDPAEMLAVGKHLVLRREEGPAGVDQIDARQAVLLRDLLRAQMLFDRNRIVGAALDRGVVGDDHAFAPGDPADARDDAGRRHVAAVHAVGGERRKLEDGRSRIDQRVDAVAREQLAPIEMLAARLVAAPSRDGCRLLSKIVDERAQPGGVGAELLSANVEPGSDCRHERSAALESAGAAAPCSRTSASTTRA